MEKSEVDVMRAASVLQDVMAERNRQDEQWGEQNHHPAYWLAILGKQVGQLGSAVLDREWYTDPDKGTQKVRDEAVQVAAVAVALIECIDKGEMPLGLVTAKPEDPRQLAKALGRGDESLNYEEEDEVVIGPKGLDPELRQECYHCGLSIVGFVTDRGRVVWAHEDPEAFRAWVDARVWNNTHAARFEPVCSECGRDNANGTHDALNSTGHLAHKFNPKEG